MPFTGYEVIYQKPVTTFLTYSSFRVPATYPVQFEIPFSQPEPVWVEHQLFAVHNSLGIPFPKQNK